MADADGDNGGLGGAIVVTLIGGAATAATAGYLSSLAPTLAMFLSLLLLAGTLVAAVLALRGRRLLAGVVLTCWIGIFVPTGIVLGHGAAFFGRFATPLPTTPLDPVQNEYLFLRHPTLGWVVVDPGEGWTATTTSGLASGLRMLPNVDGYWEWTETETDAQVVVVSSHRPLEDRNGAAFDRGVIAGAVGSLAGDTRRRPGDPSEEGWQDFSGSSAATLRWVTWTAGDQRHLLAVIAFHHPDDSFDALLAATYAPSTAWYGPGSPLPGFSPATTSLTAARRLRRETGPSFPEARAVGAATPPNAAFERIDYPTELGPMPGYLALPEGRPRGAVLWLHGGFTVGTEIDPGWGPAVLRDHDVAVLVPALRGEPGSPGTYEILLGELDDARSALAELSRRSGIPESEIVVAGHSTGATLALLLAETSIVVRAFVCFGPMSEVTPLLSMDLVPMPFGRRDASEIWVRSPLHFLPSILSPVFLIEGTEGNSEDAAALAEAAGPSVPMDVRIEEGDHFSLVVPYVEALAGRIDQPGPLF